MAAAAAELLIRARNLGNNRFRDGDGQSGAIDEGRPGDKAIGIERRAAGLAIDLAARKGGGPNRGIDESIRDLGGSGGKTGLTPAGAGAAHDLAGLPVVEEEPDALPFLELRGRHVVLLLLVHLGGSLGGSGGLGLSSVVGVVRGRRLSRSPLAMASPKAPASDWTTDGGRRLRSQALALPRPFPSFSLARSLALSLSLACVSRWLSLLSRAYDWLFSRASSTAVPPLPRDEY